MAGPRRVPQRTCLGCRSVRPKKELIRIVRTPEGAVVVDPTGKRSGRGAYLCPLPDCLERARKSRSLERALEQEIIGEGVWSGLARQLELQAQERAGGRREMDKVMSLLGFGRRARQVVSGEEGIRRAVLRRQARLLVVAEDASPQSRATYLRLARAGGVSCTIYGWKEELGRALGASARSAVAILDARLASAVAQEIGQRCGGEE